MLLSFFHNSNRWIPYFKKELGPRKSATYYWFNDRYHHHFGRERYFYFFLKDLTKEEVSFFVRQQGPDFHNLYVAYDQYSKGDRYEPPILMSSDEIIPDLIADAGYGNENPRTWKIVYPEDFLKVELQLFDGKDNPIPFNQIEVLKDIFPELELEDVAPFQTPHSDQGKFIIPGWKGVTYQEL